MADIKPRKSTRRGLTAIELSPPATPADVLQAVADAPAAAETAPTTGIATASLAAEIAASPSVAPPAPAAVSAPLKPQAPGLAHVVEAVAAPVLTQTALTQTAAEGKTTMATAAETVTQSAQQNTDKVQALFGDASARAKTAMEKGTRFYEEMGDLTKGNVEALLAASRIAAKGAETLGQEAASFSKSSLEGATAAIKNMASVKSPTELLQLQSDYARSAFDAFVAESSKITEQLVKLMGDVAQPLSTRVAVAAEKAKAVSSF